MTNPTALREELERLHKKVQDEPNNWVAIDRLYEVAGINVPNILNALKVVEVAREYHEAKKEYARRNGDGVYRSEVEENNYQLKLFSLLKPFEE